MRLHSIYLCAALVISSTSASPLPNDPPSSDTRSQSSVQEISPKTSPSSSFGSTIANLAIAGAGTALLICGGIGISEWALHWYTRFLRDKDTRNQQNQTLQDAQSRRKEQRARRERAMDLILEMAENYSDKLVSEKEFDGNFEPLTVPSSIVGAVENVFEQTADVEKMELGGDRNAMESLEELKDVLKPILKFNREDGKKSNGH